MENKNNLFNQFLSVSSKQWKQKIQVDLKGANYNKTLITDTLEGIKIKPFYHSDSFKSVVGVNNHLHKQQFKICQTIFISEERTANFLAKNALKRGADSIRFKAEKPFNHKMVLDGLSDVEIYFQLSFLDEDWVKDMVRVNDYSFKQFINIDLIGNLVRTGNWFFNNKKDHDIFKSLLRDIDEKSCGSIIGVDVSPYQNAGANTVQQVAYALAHVNEYLNFIEENKIDSVKKINFTFSIGSNYFFEIAKIRAFRYLWNLLLKEYDFEIEANIFAEPTLRNKTLYDYNVNMLRTTSECMSAILGGANVVSNISYDSIFHKRNEFGERIARNQLIIMKEESNIKNSEIADGSYYIEELTYEIAKKALQIFKDIEKSGGLVKQLFEGIIQGKIEENAKKEQELFDKGELVLLGTNKYPNHEDKMKDKIELHPFLNKKKHQTAIQQIIPKRLAEKIEIERLEGE